MASPLNIVALGTGSAIKIEAVREAFGSNFIVEPIVEAESKVPPQPVGDEETQLGATNRAMAALAAVPNARVAIGIENGMRRAKEGECEFEDVACVVGIWADGRQVVVWSDVLPIPAVLPFKKSRDGCWSELKDPHTVLTNGLRPRKAFLREALERLIEQSSCA